METISGLKDVGVEISWEVQKRWLMAYKNADWIVTELFKAMAWMASNPKRKKKNVVRFLNNWLARAKEYSMENNEPQKQVGTTLYHKKYVAPNEECDKCHGDAYMQAKNKATRALEWVRCPCVAGQNVSSTLPFFNSTAWELL